MSEEAKSHHFDWLLSVHRSQFMQQLNEMCKSMTDCTLDIQTELIPDSKKLTRVFQADANYKPYLHTLIMMDEMLR